jgi:GGDEF domain-containing protein
VSGSIGVALAGPGELELDELMRRADVAMYEAKRDKAGTWHVYQPGPELTSRLVDPAIG